MRMFRKAAIVAAILALSAGAAFADPFDLVSSSGADDETVVDQNHADLVDGSEADEDIEEVDEPDVDEPETDEPETDELDVDEFEADEDSGIDHHNPGAIVSFDRETGVLTVSTSSGKISGVVTAETELLWEPRGHGPAECAGHEEVLVGDLVPGRVVTEMEYAEDGTLKKVKFLCSAEDAEQAEKEEAEEPEVEEEEEAEVEEDSDSDS